MAQDLIAISQEAFALQLPVISSGTLKALLLQLAQFKRDNAKRLALDQAKLGDILRKESKIQRELMRRGYIKSQKEKRQFGEWQKGINTNLKRWR